MYNKLKKIVLPNLVGFKEDLTVHDKKALKNYKGAYLHAYRENGTNLILLDVSLIDYSLDKEKIENDLSSMLVYFKGANLNFHYFNGTDIIRINWENVQTIYKNFVIEVLSRKDKIEKLEINLISFELLQLMVTFRNWKQKIHESNVPSLRRLRNHFEFFKIKRTESLDDLKQQLYSNLI